MQSWQMEMLAHGAEAVLYRKKGVVIKKRIAKTYRIRELDVKLRNERTKAEARILRRLARAQVPVPKVLDANEKEGILKIEFIKGEKVRDYLKKTKDFSIFREIALNVGKMHAVNVVHGDLTTSNMILQNGRVYFIDFGLAEYSERIEDKAVDLHLLKECLKSAHFGIFAKAWKIFEQNYKVRQVMGRLKVVERRGRYKEKAPV